MSIRDFHKQNLTNPGMHASMFLQYLVNAVTISLNTFCSNNRGIKLRYT